MVQGKEKMKNLYNMYFDLHKKGIVIKISLKLVSIKRVNRIISNDQYEMPADPHHSHLSD